MADDANGIPLTASGDYAFDDAVGSSMSTGDLLSFLGQYPEYIGDLAGTTLSSAGSSIAKFLSGSGGAGLAGLAGGVLGLINPSWLNTQQKPVGYQGGIPEYTAVREAVPQTYDPNRRPGSRGQEYFTDVQYVKPDQAAAAQAQAAQDAHAAEARNKTRQAEFKAAPPRQDYAAGGLANLASGRYLGGATDGMADKIPATIANQQPAKLSHGEFVIPADVVSHLGNGNSEAGAQRLYSMMDKVRQARTGTKKQGKQINPNKFMPG